MHKKAPGYNPASLLVPMSKSSPKPTESAIPSAQTQAPVQAEEMSLDSMITPKEDPLDDLASQLQQLDSRNWEWEQEPGSAHCLKLWSREG
jgi:hypothetical protein